MCGVTKTDEQDAIEDDRDRSPRRFGPTLELHRKNPSANGGQREENKNQNTQSPYPSLVVAEMVHSPEQRPIEKGCDQNQSEKHYRNCRHRKGFCRLAARGPFFWYG